MGITNWVRRKQSQSRLDCLKKITVCLLPYLGNLERKKELTCSPL